MRDHVHKYERVKFGRNDHYIFKCMLPGCSHYLPQVILAVGQFTRCWSCNDEMLMTRAHLGVKKPTCVNCIEDRKERLERMKLIV